jgi:hypothetical protein
MVKKRQIIAPAEIIQLQINGHSLKPKQELRKENILNTFFVISCVALMNTFLHIY